MRARGVSGKDRVSRFLSREASERFTQIIARSPPCTPVTSAFCHGVMSTVREAQREDRGKSNCFCQQTPSRRDLRGFNKRKQNPLSPLFRLALKVVSLVYLPSSSSFCYFSNVLYIETENTEDIKNKAMTVCVCERERDEDVTSSDSVFKKKMSVST